MQNEERINVLETQVRTLKRIVYGFGCLLVAGLVVSATSLQTVPDVIQAKKFEVVNDKGDVLVSLVKNADGNGVVQGERFEVLNKKDDVAIALYSLHDTINDNSEGSGRITVMNSDGMPGVVMSMGAIGGYVQVNATVPKTPVLWSMMSVAQNANGGSWLGGFSIRADGGKEHFSGTDVAQMTVTAEGTGVVKTFDKDGTATSATQ